MYGTCTSWIRRRGFGFIRPDGSAEGEIFCHFSDCPDGEPLTVGTRVQYELVVFGNRYKAANVTIVALPKAGVR